MGLANSCFRPWPVICSSGRQNTDWLVFFERAQFYSIDPTRNLPRFDHGGEVCFGAEHEGRLLGDVVVVAHARGVAKLRVVFVSLEKKQV